MLLSPDGLHTNISGCATGPGTSTATATSIHLYRLRHGHTCRTLSRGSSDTARRQRDSEAVTACDPAVPVTTKDSIREHPSDNTCRPTFEPEPDQGADFQPLHLQPREPTVGALPKTPLELFQLFIPVFLVKKWVIYTNDFAVEMLWENSQAPRARIWSWKPVTVEEIYLWLGIWIYLVIFPEKTIEHHWKVPTQGSLHPTHPILKLMSYVRFNQIKRHLRIFDPSNFTSNKSSFDRCDEWSKHMQIVSIALCHPGLNVSIDECMIRFTGRSKR